MQPDQSTLLSRERGTLTAENWELFTRYQDEELLEQEESSLITLTDENGEETVFEYLDCIEYRGKEYLVLIPDEEDAQEIVILEVEPVDEENENYLVVEDEATLEAVYGIFKERYQDVLNFAE